MTRAQKHEVSQQIVSCIMKIKYYKKAIEEILHNVRLFHSGSIEIRIKGIKTIWDAVTPKECILILRAKIKEQTNKLLKFEVLIK